MNGTNVQVSGQEQGSKKPSPVVSRLKSERVQDPLPGVASRLKSERVQTTVVTAEVAVASLGLDGLAPALGEEITVKVAGRRRVRTGSGEAVTDFTVKVN